MGKMSMDTKEVKLVRRRLEVELMEIINAKISSFQNECGVVVTAFNVKVEDFQCVGHETCVFVSGVEVECRV
jgi:hypothetical protein